MVHPVNNQGQSEIKQSLDAMFKSPVSDAQVHFFLTSALSQLDSVLKEGDAASERMKKEGQDALDLAIS